MSQRRHAANLRNSLLSLLLLGDTLVCYVALTVAYWLRYESPLKRFGVDVPDASYDRYLPLIYIGTLFFVATFAALSAYEGSTLLRPSRGINALIRGVFFWLIAYLGVSLALKFDPQISRYFIVIASATTLGLLGVWRYAFFQLVSRPKIRDAIAQPVAILGWSNEAANLVEAVQTDSNHPYDFIGYVATPHTDVTHIARAPLRPVASLDNLDAFLRDNSIGILVVADLNLTREELVQVAAICERNYVSFKIIPSFFQIFVSSLRLQTISGVSILGIEALPLDPILNRALKRGVDIVGALVGLTISLPVICMLAFLIRRESKGPIMFAQERVGIRGIPFRMFKLRSMVEGAHLKDHQSQSTLRQDPRLTATGAFMRRWNLDELPQFWNVLIGDMSLVGPRPERTLHARQLSFEIPHYNTRHTVRPGMTGWAQVSGFRGDTSLFERIRYDLFYIENWSIWFDVQIMLLTFFKRQNAY
jgi:exopolysaccharide biosynthesis polyprenyl glycosylphosphotransferase